MRGIVHLTYLGSRSLPGVGEAPKDYTPESVDVILSWEDDYVHITVSGNRVDGMHSVGVFNNTSFDLMVEQGWSWGVEGVSCPPLVVPPNITLIHPTQEGSNGLE